MRARKLTALLMTGCMVLSMGIQVNAATQKTGSSERTLKASAMTASGSALAAQIHEVTDSAARTVSVKLTNIPAIQIAINRLGYADVIFSDTYELEKPDKDETTMDCLQTALIDKEGNFVFPFDFGAHVFNYNEKDNILSYADNSFKKGFNTERYYDGKLFTSKYYDSNLKELFDLGSSESSVDWDGLITTHSSIYDTTGKLLYEIPKDLQKAAVWSEGTVSEKNVKGMPKYKYKYSCSFVTLNQGSEGLVSFASLIPMDGELKLPDLKGTKWDSDKGIDYVGYFCENAIKDGKLFGFMDTSGKIVIPQSFSFASNFSDGLAIVASPESGTYLGELDPYNDLGLYDYSKQKYGYIDKTGKLVIPYEYDNAYPFNNGYAVVNKGDKWGIIDKQNNAVIPFEYECAFGEYNEDFFCVQKNGKFGAVDKDNKQVLPFVFDDITEVAKGIMYAMYDGKIVIINFNENSSSDWDKSGEKPPVCLKQVVRINTGSKTIKAKKIRKKAQKFKLAGSAVTKITYKKKSGAKGISVSSAGVVTLKKGLKKKTYKITVSAKAAESGMYKTASVSKTIKIKVK